MADGAELITEYMYGFRDIVIGSGTPYVVEKVDGLLGFPSANVLDVAKSVDHGAYPGLVTMPVRTITFDIKIVGAYGTDMEEKITAAQKAFQVPRKRYVGVPEPFTYWRVGQHKKLAYVRCTRREMASEYAATMGFGTMAIELQAPDPLIYSVDDFTETITLAADVDSGSNLMEHDGTYNDGASPIITIDGPADNPRITNNDDDGRQIKTALSMADGDVLVIDVKNRIVTLNGVRDYTILTNDSQWWTLLPGNNEIVYERDATNDADNSTCSVSWKSTYA